MVAVFAVLDLRAVAPQSNLVEVAFAVRNSIKYKTFGAISSAIKAKPLSAVAARAAEDFVPAVWTATNLTAVREVRILLPRGPLGKGDYGPGGYIFLIVRIIFHLYVQQAASWLRLRRLAEL